MQNRKSRLQKGSVPPTPNSAHALNKEFNLSQESTSGSNPNLKVEQKVPTAQIRSAAQIRSTLSLLETLFSSNVFDAVLEFFDYHSLKRVVQVCKSWRAYSDTEHFWRISANYLWATKVYVPSSIRALIIEGNSHDSRLDLDKLTVKELRKAAPLQAWIRMGVLKSGSW